MQRAMAEAEAAFAEEEIPVGAVIVEGNRLIARAHNQCMRLGDNTAHAEMIAITAAQNHLNSRYLSQCTLYVTLEPCAMCAGAMAWTQLYRLVFAASDPTKGFLRWGQDLLHPKTIYQSGLCQAQAQQLIQEFFAQIRNKNP